MAMIPLKGDIFPMVGYCLFYEKTDRLQPVSSSDFDLFCVLSSSFDLSYIFDFDYFSQLKIG